MNYGTIKSLITRNLGRSTDINVYLSEWINNCYLDLISRAKFPELGRSAPIPVPLLDATRTFDTVDGTANYSHPNTVLFPITVRDTTNNQPLARKDIRWYDRNKATTNGKPFRYALFGGEMWLDPCPDSLYTIQERYRKKFTLPVLLSDADVPIIGQEWHEAIVLGGTHRGAASLGYPDSDVWFNRYKGFVGSHSEQHTEEEEDADVGFSIVM